jgi:hypothetical protein
MRKVLEGSRIDRGKKNRRNMKKLVARNPATLAQTIRRLILLTGAELSTTAPGCGTGRAAAAGTAVFGAGGAAAGGVPAGVSITDPPIVSCVLELSTNANLHQLRSATWVGSKVLNEDTRLLPMQSESYNFPQGRELSLLSGSNFRVNIKSSAPKKFMKLARSANL